MAPHYMTTYLVNTPGLDHHEVAGVLRLGLRLQEGDGLARQLLQPRPVVGLVDLVVPVEVGVGEDAEHGRGLHVQVQQLVPALDVDASRVCRLPLLDEAPVVELSTKLREVFTIFIEDSYYRIVFRETSLQALSCCPTAHSSSRMCRSPT